MVSKFAFTKCNMYRYAEAARLTAATDYASKKQAADNAKVGLGWGSAGCCADNVCGVCVCVYMCVCVCVCMFLRHGVILTPPPFLHISNACL
jgi:hypothetical protein